MPELSAVTFLDIEIHESKNHTFCIYKTKSDKGILGYDYGHSKLIKRSITCSCMTQSIKKLCGQKVGHSLTKQVAWLKGSAYTGIFLLVSIADKVLRAVTGKKQEQKGEVEKKVRSAVLPYIHTVSHILKKIASRHDVPLLFTSPKNSQDCAQK